MQQIYSGRNHTHKHNRGKSKLSQEERELRIAKKLFQKMFPNMSIVKIGLFGRKN